MTAAPVIGLAPILAAGPAWVNPCLTARCHQPAREIRCRYALEQSLPVRYFRGAQNGMIRALSGDAGHIVFARLLGRLPRWT
jgi:hypothetical protein